MAPAIGQTDEVRKRGGRLRYGLISGNAIGAERPTTSGTTWVSRVTTGSIALAWPAHTALRLPGRSSTARDSSGETVDGFWALSPVPPGRGHCVVTPYRQTTSTLDPDASRHNSRRHACLWHRTSTRFTTTATIPSVLLRDRGEPHSVVPRERPPVVVLAPPDRQRDAAGKGVTATPLHPGPPTERTDRRILIDRRAVSVELPSRYPVGIHDEPVEPTIDPETDGSAACQGMTTTCGSHSQGHFADCVGWGWVTLCGLERHQVVRSPLAASAQVSRRNRVHSGKAVAGSPSIRAPAGE